MIRKVVLTGGPGSGKTTVIESIKKNYGGKYKVIIVDETASYLINMGIRPFGENSIPLIDFQELVLKTQLSKEEVIDKSLEFLPDENILIIYDRGIMDNAAYISEEEFKEVIERVKTKETIQDFFDRYDLVLNLVSRKDFYTTDNNPARSETVDDALSLGEKTLKVWTGHKNLKIVSPKDDINDKIKDVLNYINDVLQEEQVKRQAKYYVDLNLTDMDYVKKISRVANIEQTYLESEDNVEKRLRKITMCGATTYSYTIHKIVNDKRIKISDNSISERTFNELFEFRDQKKNTINKDRYYFPYKDKYYTLDIIDDYGLLEINISEDEQVIIPPFIGVIEDVSKNEDFLNVNLSNADIKNFTKH